MFILIQKELVNIDHIVSCQPTSGVTVVNLDTSRRLNIPTTEFEANVLPLLPMIKMHTEDLTILPPEEVQVSAPVELLTEETLSKLEASDPVHDITQDQYDELIAQVEKVAPPSNPVVDPQSKPKSRKKAA